MELSEDYHYFFDNKGKCPNCDAPLVMHIGCINPDCVKFIENLIDCRVSVLQSFYFFKYLLSAKVRLHKAIIKNKRKNGENLDKTRKKVYIKDDN